MPVSNFRLPRARALSVLAAAAALALVPATAAHAATLPTLSIAVSPSGATVGGSFESGAVDVVTTDTGVKEAFVILVALKPGVSLAEGEAFAKSTKTKDPNNVSEIGAIVYDSEANPGPPSEVQTELKAGQYLLLSGAGEGEPSVRTHFTVTAAKSPATLPAPQATVKTIEFGFRGPSTLRDGELVRFEDEGFLVHMDFAAPVKNVKAARKAVKLLREGKEKAVGKLIAGPPVDFQGPVSHGAFQQETITAKPGVYVEVCFMETQDGRDHALLGMERIIKITK